jgi:hypothetical protein
VLRLTPQNLRIDLESFEVVAAVLASRTGRSPSTSSSTSTALSERRAHAFGRGQTVHTQSTLSHSSPEGYLCRYLAQRPAAPPQVDANFTVLRLKPSGTGTSGTLLYPYLSCCLFISFSYYILVF